MDVVGRSGLKSCWFGVRCVFAHHWSAETGYEERITLWKAETVDEAIALAEQEAADYGAAVSATYVGLAQAYELVDTPGHGAEIYSLIRDSALPPDAYLTAFFSTGTERQGTSD